MGLPQSGTTLAASIFDAHPRSVVCYEPWNRERGEGERGRGGEGMVPEQTPQGLATKFHIEIVPGISRAIYAYEALTAEPSMTLPRLMAALDLEFSDQQLDYFRNFSSEQVRSDLDMSKNPRPISSDSVAY